MYFACYSGPFAGIRPKSPRLSRIRPRTRGGWDENRRGAPTRIASLRERLSRLNEASLRVIDSLDLGVVLREPIESALALTGAPLGGIFTLDDDGRMLEFVGSGFTDHEYDQLMSLPEGQRVFEYLSAASEPLRTPDLSEHVRSQGFPGAPLLMKTFLGTPVRHRSRHVAHFYLGESEGVRDRPRL